MCSCSWQGSGRSLNTIVHYKSTFLDATFDYFPSSILYLCEDEMYWHQFVCASYKRCHGSKFCTCKVGLCWKRFPLLYILHLSLFHNSLMANVYASTFGRHFPNFVSTNCEYYTLVHQASISCARTTFFLISCNNYTNDMPSTNTKYIALTLVLLLNSAIYYKYFVSNKCINITPECNLKQYRGLSDHLRRTHRLESAFW